MISPTPKVLTEADLAGLPRAVSSEEARQKIDKAWRVVSSLCDGTQRWTMSVPARPDSDPDLVISDALRCARALVSERDALRTENESLVRGLRGKHALTGATYEHLVSERDALAGRVAELERHNKALVARREHDVNDIKKYSVMVGRLEAAAQPFVKLFQEADANRDQPMDGRSSIDAQIAVNDLRRLVYAADDADAALSATTPESKP